MRIELPILTLPVREQAYSCHGCGNCCRDFTVQLRAEDLERLEAQGWAERLGEPVTVEFRGVRYLRQRGDGSCVFLLDDGRCRIHAEHGFEAKPIACQLFPFHLTPTADGVRMGVSFACQSVLENRGAALETHARELRRMSAALPELGEASGRVALAGRLGAEPAEIRALAGGIDAWLRDLAAPLDVRLDGLAWIAQSLGEARLDGVRGERFVELVDVLAGALPEELDELPVEPASARQRRMLREAVFARTEDPKVGAVARAGRARTVLGQLARRRRLRAGRGTAPAIGVGWPEDVPLADVETVGPARGDARIAVDELVARFVRGRVLGGRAWGAGYYGWSMVDGLQALVLDVAATGWLARLHAAGAGRASVEPEDIRAALGRVDRTAGRAPWLGTGAERLRLRYLRGDDGLRRLVRSYAPSAG